MVAAPVESESTKLPASARPASLVASHKARAFALAFTIAGPILYLLCSALNLPLITYHPAMNRIDFGWSPARSGEGPAMYWYGWTLSVLLGATAAGLLATLLPDRATQKIPLYLVWLLPILSIPLLAYSLREFWLHP
jgi:hypothetical protein